MSLWVRSVYIVKVPRASAGALWRGSIDKMQNRGGNNKVYSNQQWAVVFDWKVLQPSVWRSFQQKQIIIHRTT